MCFLNKPTFRDWKKNNQNSTKASLFHSNKAYVSCSRQTRSGQWKKSDEKNLTLTCVCVYALKCVFLAKMSKVTFIKVEKHSSDWFGFWHVVGRLCAAKCELLISIQIQPSKLTNSTQSTQKSSPKINLRQEAHLNFEQLRKIQN